ncbi:transposase [Alicyclobacillus tolerans]|uniref:transposase n=1 Tax=Alicyclobacillus tolerans TaxID=90970 RepID=UPI001F02F260|nr:transposase [Alicyclobacillus tolerans]MCF8568330.1 transposase [Alicyclobacillus tolerans]
MVKPIISQSTQSTLVPFPLIPRQWERYVDVPFVIPALTFPWDIFCGIEQDYYQHLHDVLRKERMNRSTKAVHANDSALDLELPIPIEQVEDTLAVGRSRFGRKPHDFMPMMRAFELARLLYVEIMVESVYLQVRSNPLFAEACGFKGKLPRYRSFARFDQIMTDFGLWEKARQQVIAFNLKQGVLGIEDTLVADTTHIEAEATYGRQMKTCGHKEDCDCPRVPTDDNVGIVRKSNTVSYVGHKVSLLSGAKGQLPLTHQVFQGGEYDAFTLQPTLERFKSEFEDLAKFVEYVLADGIYQTTGNQKATKEVLGAKLLAPINPRGRKDKPSDVRGIDKIDRYGIPHCIAGYKMELKGCNLKKEQYIFTCPVRNPQTKQEGLVCPHHKHIECCSGATQGCVLRVDFSTTPQVDSEFPQHSRTFDILYDARTGIERIIGMLKDGYSLRRVHKRGRKAVEAHVDQCMVCMHVMAHCAHAQTGTVNRGWTRGRLKRAQ